MFKSVRGRVVTIIVMAGISVFYLVNNSIKLGLDLQGGMHLVLEVDDPQGQMSTEEKSDMIDRAERILRTRIDEFGVEEPLIQKIGSERIIVELPGIDDQDRAKELIQQTAFLQFKLVVPAAGLESSLSRIDRQIVLAVGADSLRQMGNATNFDAPQNELESLIFGGQVPDSVGTEELDPVVDEEEEQSLNLRPFTALLASGDTEGTYLVSLEDVETASYFLGLPEVQLALTSDQ